MILRNLYVLRRSWPRILKLVYWPPMQLVMWGFITTFLFQHSTWVAQAAGVLIGLILLLDVLFRSNLGIALPFIKEMRARNLGQLFATLLRPYVFVVALTLMSAIRTAIVVAPASILASPLYDVWVFELGPPLIAFSVNLLVLGWSVGLAASGLVLRCGLGAESLSWLGVFLMAPVGGIYYPIASLPKWLQPVAWAIPASHVIGGMRSVLFDSVFRHDLLIAAIGLNIVYLGLAASFSLYTFRVARHCGLLSQQGE